MEEHVIIIVKVEVFANYLNIFSKKLRRLFYAKSISYME